MEARKCAWEPNTGSVPMPQHAAVTGLEFAASVVDESLARTMMGMKNSPKLPQQTVFTANNTSVTNNMEMCDRQLQVCEHFCIFLYKIKVIHSRRK